MELWLIYAIITAFFAGIHGFLIKILSEKDVNGSLLTFVQGIIYIILGFSQTMISGGMLFSRDNIDIIGLSLFIGCVIYAQIRVRAHVLQYLSVSEYFIGFRILTTVFLIIIGIIFFAESLTGGQVFGLILGSISILLLFEKNANINKTRNWHKAMTYLFLSILIAGLFQTIGKIQGTTDFPYSSMFFYQGISMLLISSIIDHKSVQSHLFSIIRNQKIFFITFITVLFVYISATFNLLAYHAGGNVSIVTKIIAYSLFISIGLSILFGKEKLTYKKGIAFVLTLISIYYLN